VYFSRGEARVSAVTNPATSHGTRIEVDGLGAESPSLVAWLSGFWQRMLELAGARDVKVVAMSSRGRGDDKSSVTIRWR
jgi:plasmid replication initiation protein